MPSRGRRLPSRSVAGRPPAGVLVPPFIQGDPLSRCKSSAKAKTMIGRAMKEGSHFFEWTHKSVDGKEFPATVLLTKMKFKGKEFLQATVRSITGQKSVEKKLEKKNLLLI